MSSSLRRLAAEHASLRRTGLPPNYLFPQNQDSGILPDDLTELTILLTGAQGTPYMQGLWQLQLRMPTDYPKNPPRATFKTRMWHPNVEESTGAVCLETLKRDWDPKLTLKDILLTISCLLIHPNPDSALNSAAGTLLQDDYEAFAEQTRLMTSIHARIPVNMRQAVDAARRRGEVDQATINAKTEGCDPASRTKSRPGSTLLRKKLPSTLLRLSALPLLHGSAVGENDGLPDDEEDHDPSKENDPSQSPSPVTENPRSPRKKVSGKRPLSELPTPTDPEDGMTDSEKNIAVNQDSEDAANIAFDPPKKSPRLAVTSASAYGCGRSRGETVDVPSVAAACAEAIPVSGDDGNQNFEHKDGHHFSQNTKVATRAGPNSDAASLRPTLRKVSNMSSIKAKAQPRVGIRRL